MQMSLADSLHTYLIPCLSDLLTGFGLGALLEFSRTSPGMPYFLAIQPTVNNEDQDETNAPFINYTITSISIIQDLQVSDRQESDGEVIGCLNMLTWTYTTGRRQHYCRED
jgi:hypothetical protein